MSHRTKTPRPVGYYSHLEGLAGNTTVADGQVTIWFVERPVQWPFRSVAEREADMQVHVRAWTALAGKTIHRRVSPRQHDVTRWARGLDMDTPNPADWPAWSNYLQDSQRILAGKSMAEPMVFLGVEVGSVTPWSRLRGRFAKDKAAAGERAAAALATEVEQVRSALAEIADPATQRELEWLLHRSIGLCLPAPLPGPGAGDTPMDVYDLAAAFESVDVEPGDGLSRSLRIVGAPGRHGPQPVEQHVVIMSLGRPWPQIIPEVHNPWLAHALRYGGVEISMRGDLLSGADAARSLKKPSDQIIDQVEQRRRHGLDLPPVLLRTYEQIMRTRDVMEEGHPDDATRWHGQVRIAIHGSTAAEAFDRADKLRQHMLKQRLDVHVMPASVDMYREFTPGSPVATTAHTRRMDMDFLVRGVPQAAYNVGDGRGLHLGQSVSLNPAPFMWAMWDAMEKHDRSGLCPIVGDLGAGKSFFLGGVAALAAFTGVDVTIFDPAGALAAITRWAPIADQSQVLNIQETYFSPYFVFPQPRPEDFDDDPRLAGLTGRALTERLAALVADAEKDAAAERAALVLDCLRAVLPVDLAKVAESRLRAAIRGHNNCRVDSTVAGVLKELRRQAGDDPLSLELADTLDDIATMPKARNWMGANYYTSAAMVDARLLVVTMEGLTLPSLTDDKASWSVSERLSVPLLHLAVHYAYSRIYRKGDKGTRKLVGFDEAHYLADWNSGRDLLRKIERDSRKWNVRAFVASQDYKTTLQAQEASRALIYDAIVAHCSDPDEQAGCAERLLHLDPIFKSEIGRLRSADSQTGRDADQPKRRDLMVRVNGQVGRVQFALDEVPDLAALLNTTPARVIQDLEPAETQGWWN